MRRALVVLGIIILAMLACGCMSGCGIFDPSMRRTIFADDLDNPSNNSTISGVWSSTNASVVDPGIAFESGYGPAADGQWIIFKESGYFKYVNMSASGGIFRYGLFSAGENSLHLLEVNESYYPGPGSQLPSYRNRALSDENLSFVILDNDTLAIRGGAENGTYYRLYR